jgi:fatty-acid peroxygenase
MRGPEAAAAFYVPGRFTRRGAVPATTVSLLQGLGSVQSLDGAQHRTRKRMFLSLMTEDHLSDARQILAEEWAHGLRAAGTVSLLDAAHLVLCRVALRWCGLGGALEQHRARTAEFRSMIEGAGSIGYPQLRGQLLRRRSERWAASVIEHRRQSAGQAPADVVARAEDENGQPLPRRIAAIELINLLRPTVAVARFITFAAHAMHLYPAWRERVASSRQATAFAHEVRRFYPFFPAVGGRVLQPFSLRGHKFQPGDWVLLDLYGTNHHSTWGDPEHFRPERFLDHRLSEARLVAQGSGDHLKTHRCAGEQLTVELLSEACQLLARMDYEVPEQDLSIPLNRFPTAPRNGMRLVLR